MASVSTAELRRKLIEAGCELVREGAKHEIWRNSGTGKVFSVPRKLKGEGTLLKILKDAGLR